MLRRAGAVVLQAIGLVWAAATLAFVMSRLIPGDPVSVMLGPNAQVSEEVRAQLREQMGLDLPLWQQYFQSLGAVASGDFGRSYQLGQPVVEVVAKAFGPTLQLALLASVFATAIIIVVALFVRGPKARAVAGAFEQVVLATPLFWSALLFLGVFSFGLGWFPVGSSGGFNAVVLPAITLALPLSAISGQVLRDGVEAAERAPFAETVVARGASDTRLLTSHTLRHGAIGLVPMAAYLFGSVVGGAVLVESVFARPGLGSVALAAISGRDLPVISGVIIWGAVLFAVVTVLGETLTLALDPRQRIERAR